MVQNIGMRHFKEINSTENGDRSLFSVKENGDTLGYKKSKHQLFMIPKSDIYWKYPNCYRPILRLPHMMEKAMMKEGKRNVILVSGESPCHHKYSLKIFTRWADSSPLNEGEHHLWPFQHLRESRPSSNSILHAQVAPDDEMQVPRLSA
ncbi:hypothetical protein LXL04_034287 [Taraxacum kok-saghyz]